MQHIIDAMKVEVEEQVAALFGSTFFLDTPTPARLQKWRAKAQDQASARAGFAYAPYGHLKLSAVVEELVGTVDRLAPPEGDIHQRNRRNALWDEVRARGSGSIAVMPTGVTVGSTASTGVTSTFCPRRRSPIATAQS